MGRRLAVVLWLAVLLAGLHVVTARTAVVPGSAGVNLVPPPLSRLEPRVVDVLTLGYHGLYDDFATIWTLQVLVDERLKSKDPGDVQSFLATVASQHPRIESFYMLSCFVLALDLKRPKDCESLTLAGLKALPDSWRIPVTQGYMELHQLNDPQRAALYYGLAASRPKAPAFLGPLATHLTERNGLSPEELQQTLDNLLGTPGGAQLLDILRGHKT